MRSKHGSTPTFRRAPDGTGLQQPVGPGQGPRAAHSQSWTPGQLESGTQWPSTCEAFLPRGLHTQYEDPAHMLLWRDPPVSACQGPRDAPPFYPLNIWETKPSAGSRALAGATSRPGTTQPGHLLSPFKIWDGDSALGSLQG